MPEPLKILATIKRATELFRKTPGRQGGLIRLQDADEVMVVGDLHGNIPAMKQVLNVADLAKNPKRHLVLQELVHGTRFYPDEKGEKSHQLVDLVCALKCQTPDRVHLILGNHELSELTGRFISKNGVALNVLFRNGVQTAYGQHAEEIYRAYLDLFATLPLAVRTENRVFLCHTIPDPIDLDRLDLAAYDAESWTPEWMARGGTVYGLTWGRNSEPETVDRFAQMVDADLFVTGHQPCDEGFRLANHRQIIIDGTDPYPAYCLFPAKTPITIDELFGCVKLLPMSV